MSGGIRITCGACFTTTYYNEKLQRCDLCGWTPKPHKKLTEFNDNDGAKHD